MVRAGRLFQLQFTMLELFKCKISASLFVYFYRRHYFPNFLKNSSRRCNQEATCDKRAKTVMLTGTICKKCEQCLKNNYLCFSEV